MAGARQHRRRVSTVKTPPVSVSSDEGTLTDALVTETPVDQATTADNAQDTEPGKLPVRNSARSIR